MWRMPKDNERRLFGSRNRENTSSDQDVEKAPVEVASSVIHCRISSLLYLLRSMVYFVPRPSLVPSPAAACSQKQVPSSTFFSVVSIESVSSTKISDV